MRNAFVVIVFLYIGRVSGFVVPSGGLELMGEDQAILADNSGKYSEESKTTRDDTNTGFIVLPFRTVNKNKVDLQTNKNRIKDKEIYDQHSVKQNNVNERSFVYINQKYKTPVANLYNSHDLLQETYIPVEGNVEDPRKYPLYLKTKKEYFEPNFNAKQDFQNLYISHTPSKPYKAVMSTENRKEFNINQEGKKVRMQHDFLELLKAPLLRPVKPPIVDNKRNKPVNLTPPQQNLNQPANYGKVLQKATSPIDASSVSYYDNYGFPTPFGYQQSKYIYSEDSSTDYNVKRLINENNNAEIRKLMERYWKETIGKQRVKDNVEAKSDNCSYSDCILKSRKQYIHTRLHTEPECSCGRKLNGKKMRNEESNRYSTRELSKETTDKPLYISTETYNTPKSSEINDYSDILAEEMNLKKLIEE